MERVEVRDLYRFAKLEQNRHQPANGWNHEQWWAWVTEKLFEHMQGDVRWAQFDAEKFGVFKADDSLKRDMLNRYHSLKSRGMGGPEAEAFFEDVNAILAS